MVLFTGSSSIRLWKNLKITFPHTNTLNRGFGGAHISDLLFFYELLFPKYRPQQVVMYCGENDLWSGKSVQRVFKDFSELSNKIAMDLPETELIYLSCKPSPKRISKWETYQTLNRKIENVCASNSKFKFLDLSSTLLKKDITFHEGLWKKDLLHINEAGYRKWASKLGPLLIQNSKMSDN